MGIKEVRIMAKKRFVIHKDDIRDFCRKGWKSKVIGFGDNIILVEAEVPEEETANRKPIAMKDPTNEPGEC